VNSKYTKYSTEQLEVIFTHLTDPAEKELVKKELSSRYYQHYLNISNGSPEQFRDSGAAVPERPAAASPGAEEALFDEPEAEAEDLADLGELQPIKLTSTVSPEPAPGPVPPPEKARKYCFIATAAYGSPWAREVVLLQNYRDDCLARRPWGRTFIRAYYRLSPCPAKLIGQNQILKLIARSLLTPLIFLIEKLPQSDKS
jgi:hypothetical protein